MKVVLIAQTYAKGMGYLENILPKYLKAEGLDVSVLALGLLPYYQNQLDRPSLIRFVDLEGLRQEPFELIEGVPVYTVPPGSALGYTYMPAFLEMMEQLRPDVVQLTVAAGWLPLQAWLGKRLFGYRLFTGNHNASSGFALAREKRPYLKLQFYFSALTRFLPGRWVGGFTERCFAVTIDCARIAISFLGVPAEKVELMHLGVDLKSFYPFPEGGSDPERQRVRKSLGVSESEILCIYTGKMNPMKNASCLASAVGRLQREGRPFRALFIGDGVERGIVSGSDGCQVLDFMPYHELGAYFRAADIGVWTGNESTSMLDGAACGLPIVISDLVEYREHVEGNGLVFTYQDEESLCEVLRKLESSQVRQRMGRIGAHKMAGRFSWEGIARLRAEHYLASARPPLLAWGASDPLCNKVETSLINLGHSATGIGDA